MEYAKSRSVAHTTNNVKLTAIIRSVHIVPATKQALKLHAGSARDSASKKTMTAQTNTSVLLSGKMKCYHYVNVLKRKPFN